MSFRPLLPLILLFALFSPPGELRAQSLLSGHIRDKDSKEPLAGAYVLGFSGSKLKAYAYSDAEGSFSLKIPEGVMLDELRVSLMGHASVTVPVKAGQDNLRIEMREQRAVLHGAKIVASSTEERGDTISFSAGAFRDGTERSVGDLLERLPGISVSASGGIQHEGTPIGKLYVEGMDLMGARYGVVTRNLSADAIERIEVYRNHQPVRALQNIAVEERSAVNIILKENIRGTWMFSGDAVLGMPRFPLFEGRAMLSRFSKKDQSLCLLKGNNNGGDILQELQLQAQGNSPGVFIVKPGEVDSDFRSRLSPGRNYLTFPKAYWYDNLSGLGSGNYLVKTGTYTQLRLAAHAAGERYKEQQERREEIRFADGNVLELVQNHTLTDRQDFFAGTVTLESNAPRRYVNEALHVTGQLRTYHSALTGNGIPYGQQYDLPGLKIENQFKATVRRRENRALEWKSNGRYLRNHHTADFVRENRKYAQHLFAQDFYTDLTVKQNRTYGRHHIGLSAEGAVDYVTREARAENVQVAGVKTEGSLSVFALRPGVRLSDVVNLGRSRLSLTLPVSLHCLSVNGTKSIVYPSLTPVATLQWTLSKRMTLAASSSYSLRRSDYETLLDAAVMQSWRTLSQSDSLRCTARWNNQATLRWSDIPSMLFATLSTSWSMSGTDRSTASVWLEDMTWRYSVPLAVATSGWNANGSVKKYIGVNALIVSLNGGWSQNRIQEFLQGKSVSYDATLWFTRATVEGHPARWLSFSLSGKYEQKSVRGASAQQNRTLQVDGSVHVNPVRALAIDADFFWLQTEMPGITFSNTPLARLEISWKLPSAVLFVECRNLFDATAFRQESVSAYRTTSSVTTLRGRLFLAGVRMSLK